MYNSYNQNRSCNNIQPSMTHCIYHNSSVVDTNIVRLVEYLNNTSSMNIQITLTWHHYNYSLLPLLTHQLAQILILIPPHTLHFRSDHQTILRSKDWLHNAYKWHSPC